MPTLSRRIGQGLLVAVLLAGLTTTASAQLSRRSKTAFGPIVETSETPALRAARLAIEEDAVRRFRATGQAPRVQVDSRDRFEGLCARYTAGRETPAPLPCSTWGEAKESAAILQYDYLVLVELWEGAELPDNPEAGVPIEFNYQIYDAIDQSVVQAKRFVGNTIDLSGALASLCKQIGLNVGYDGGAEFDEAVASIPTLSREAFSEYWLGKGYLDMGLFDEGLARFEKAVELDPAYRAASVGTADVHLATAQHALDNGEWAAGLASADLAVASYAALSADGGLADALGLKADLLVASGDRPASWIARKSAAKALMEWGRTRSAMETAQLVWDEMQAEGAPVDADVAWLLGKANVLLHGRGEMVDGVYVGPSNERADDLFAQALAADPDHAPTYLERGKMYLKYGIRYDPSFDDDQKYWRNTWIGYAVKDLKRVTALAPDLCDGWVALGDAYIAWSYRGVDVSDDERSITNGQIGQAIANYQRALNILRDQDREMDPEMGQLFMKLASAHRQIGRLEDALDAAWLAQTILGEDYVQPWIEIILIYVEGDEFDEARTAYEEAMLAVPAPPGELSKMLTYIDQAEERFDNSGRDFQPHRWPGRRAWPPE